MTTPTPAEVSSAKAAALGRSPIGSDRVLQVDVSDPVTGFEGVVLCAPLTLPAWKEHVDIDRRSSQHADSKLFADSVLWPDFDTAQKMRGEHACLITQVRSEILTDAGCSQERVTISKLTATNRPAWLAAEEAEKLRAENGQLYVATYPTGLCTIQRAPSPEVYMAAVAARNDANAMALGIIDSTLGLASELVVRSSEPLEQAMQKKPPLSADLWQAMQLLGGLTAKVRSKSL